jgi:hypothetical protein
MLYDKIARGRLEHLEGVFSRLISKEGFQPLEIREHLVHGKLRPLDMSVQYRPLLL